MLRCFKYNGTGHICGRLQLEDKIEWVANSEENVDVVYDDISEHVIGNDVPYSDSASSLVICRSLLAPKTMEEEDLTVKLSFPT